MTTGEILLVKARVRDRDGMRCTSCGMTNDEHFAAYGVSLDVHRTVPGSQYSADPGVCVTLCKPCHGPMPRRPRGTFPSDTSPTVRIKGAFAELVEVAAKELAQDFTQYVNDALRMRLAAEGRWPPPARPRG